MDLDDLKAKVKNVKVPAMAEAAGNSSASAYDLIDALKRTDRKQLTMLRRGRIFLLTATAIFLFALAASWFKSGPDSASWTERMLPMGAMVCIYGFITILAFVNIRKLSRVDYAVPVREFLRQAELRYRFMRPSDWVLIVLGLLFVGGLSGIAYVPYLSRVFGFSGRYMSLIFSLFLLSVAALGTYFTKKDWKRDRAELWLHIKQLQQELEHQ